MKSLGYNDVWWNFDANSYSVKKNIDNSFTDFGSYIIFWSKVQDLGKLSKIKEELIGLVDIFISASIDSSLHSPFFEKKSKNNIIYYIHSYEFKK